MICVRLSLRRTGDRKVKRAILAPQGMASLLSYLTGVLLLSFEGTWPQEWPCDPASIQPQLGTLRVRNMKKPRWVPNGLC